jgi:hypothetical protein
VVDGLIRSDRWFTTPCVVVILISGIVAAGRAGPPILGTGWLQSVALLIIPFGFMVLKSSLPGS